MSAVLLFSRATLHHRAGRYADAERDYLEILKTDDRDADALRLLAALYVQAGDPARAVEFFERAHKAQPDNAETLNNLGVALRHCGRLDEAMARYEQAFALAPDFIKARANLIAAYGECGLEYVRQQRWSEAAALFEKGLRLDPHNARLLNNLGTAYREQGAAEEACAYYRQALQAKPDYVEAQINLGGALRDCGDFDGAKQNYEAALHRQPHNAATLNNLGTLHQDLNRWPEALAYYDRALQIDPDSVDAKTNKAFALLALGQYREGWALHEAGFNVPNKRGTALFSERLWDGRDFHGQRLLIWPEQGLGDNLQFIRYALLCKQRGGTVKILAPQPLARLYANWPILDEIVTTASESDFDWHIPVMSLPHIFQTTLENIPAAIPYLFVDDKTRAKWAGQLLAAKKFKVGLVWAGSAHENRADTHIFDKRRNLSLELLKPLLDQTDIDFISLQMGKPAGQIDELGLRDRMIDPMPGVTDMLDTAAIIENLDLVISVDTSVAHLAGALGKPVWILSRYDACWRWLRNRPDSPWYPAARIFGQKEPGAWQEAVEDVRRALVSFAASSF